MSLTVSGFDYPGDSSVAFRLKIFKSLILILSILSSLITTFFDFLFFYYFFPTTESFLLLVLLLDFLFKTWLVYKKSLISQFTGDFKKHNYRFFLKGKVNFHFISDYLTIFLLNIILIETFFIFIIVYYLVSIPHKIYKNLFNNSKSKSQLPLEGNLYPFNNTIPNNTFQQTNCNIVKFDQEFMVGVENNVIKIYSLNDLKNPFYVLKGHIYGIIKIFITNRFIVSYDIHKIGLWDKFNSFKFSDSYKNVLPSSLLEKNSSPLIQNIQIVNNYLFYSYKNQIYINDSEFMEPSTLFLDIDLETILYDFKVYGNTIYCLTYESNFKFMRITVYDFFTKNLLNYIEEDTHGREELILGHLVVNETNVVLCNEKSIVIYERLPTLIKRTIVNVEIGDMMPIGANDHFYFMEELIWDPRPDRHILMSDILKIYSNSTEFKLLKEYPIESILEIRSNDEVLVRGKNGTIYQYHINDLIRL